MSVKPFREAYPPIHLKVIAPQWGIARSGVLRQMASSHCVLAYLDASSHLQRRILAKIDAVLVVATASRMFS